MVKAFQDMFDAGLVHGHLLVSRREGFAVKVQECPEASCQSALAPRIPEPLRAHYVGAAKARQRLMKKL